MKKLISLLLALIMVLSLAACGGDSKTPDNGSKTPAKRGRMYRCRYPPS